MASIIERALRKVFPARYVSKHARAAHRLGQANENVSTYVDGGVVLWDEFLPKEDFIKIQHWAADVLCDRSRESRKWGEYLIRDYGECYGSRQWSSEHDDVPAQLRLFMNAVRKTKLVPADAEIHAGIYRWQPTSGMGQHTDSHTNTAVTFYLNDAWQDDWCGEFVFYENADNHQNGIGYAVSPRANRLVINRNTVPHKVTYTSNLSIDRITVQAFLPKN